MRAADWVIGSASRSESTRAMTACAAIDFDSRREQRRRLNGPGLSAAWIALSRAAPVSALSGCHGMRTVTSPAMTRTAVIAIQLPKPRCVVSEGVPLAGKMRA